MGCVGCCGCRFLRFPSWQETLTEWQLPLYFVRHLRQLQSVGLSGCWPPRPSQHSQQTVMGVACTPWVLLSASTSLIAGHSEPVCVRFDP
jgi:hypothetical protein